MLLTDKQIQRSASHIRGDETIEIIAYTIDVACPVRRIFELSKTTNTEMYQSGWNSSVGIAIQYWLDGPEIESRWEGDFPNQLRPVLWPTQPPVQSKPGLKRPGSDVDHLLTSTVEVKERVDLYNHTLCGASWQVIG